MDGRKGEDTELYCVCAVGVVSELDDQLTMPRVDRRQSHKVISHSRSSPHIPDPYLLPTYESVLSPDADLLDRVKC